MLVRIFSLRPVFQIQINPLRDPHVGNYLFAGPISFHDDVEISNWIDSKETELEIDKDACVPRWHTGGKMDWDLAVAQLFN